MSDTDRRKFQLETEVDATGARAGFAEVAQAGRDMAQDVAQSGKKAADGLKQPETQSQQTAAAMSRAERNMVGSIQRAAVALKSGGKAGSDYYEILAQQRGISSEDRKSVV